MAKDERSTSDGSDRGAHDGVRRIGHGAHGRARRIGHGAHGRARRIGLYGGSFDPPHLGHLRAARLARDTFALDRVAFVPAAQPPHKPGRRLADGGHRVELLRLLVRDDEAFCVSDLELRRGGKSFTIDTVRALPRELGEPDDCELFLIVGSDNVPGLATWRDARALLERVQPVIVHREGDPDVRIAELRTLLGDVLADKCARGYLRLPALDASSSALRDALAHAERNARDDVDVLPTALRAYIDAHGLYRAGDA